MSRKTERFLLLFVDFIAINAAWMVHYIFRIESGMVPYSLRPDFVLPMLIICTFWYFVFIFFGLYRPWYAKSRIDELFTIVKAVTIGVLLLFFIIFIDDEARGVAQVSSRLLIFGYWFAMVSFVGAGRMIIRTFQHRLLERGIGHRKTIIVGDSDRATSLLDLLSKYPALGYAIVGIVTQKGEKGESLKNGVPVLGKYAKLPAIIKDYGIQEVLIALDIKQQDKIVSIIDKTDGLDVGLKILPDLYSTISGQVRTNQIYGVPLIEVTPTIMQPWQESVKRTIDILFSLFILTIGSLLWLIISLAIRIESKGTAFYRQERVGKDGKVFIMYKFRSMYQDAEKLSGPTWAGKKDPRVTFVGGILRKLHLDEIPQFINIMKGDMSLIGPRPERPFFVEQFNKQIPLYSRRHLVRPGLSGWAQVKHKYDETIEDVKIKLQYDLYYIENMSITMDLKIVLMTMYRMVLGRGH
jgi:exopolysaccharide biosynthesis polyprenyl glycosylphosphotransferase